MCIWWASIWCVLFWSGVRIRILTPSRHDRPLPHADAVAGVPTGQGAQGRSGGAVVPFRASQVRKQGARRMALPRGGAAQGRSQADQTCVARAPTTADASMQRAHMRAGPPPRAPPAAQFAAAGWARGGGAGCGLDAEDVQTRVGTVACPSSARTGQIASPHAVVAHAVGLASLGRECSARAQGGWLRTVRGVGCATSAAPVTRRPERNPESRRPEPLGGRLRAHRAQATR